MITYYDVTKRIYEHLINDPDVNTVILGDIDDIDIDKQTMFPTSLITPTQATPINGIMRFNLTISCMDIIDHSKNNPIKGDWKGYSNQQDIWNTQLAVLENLWRSVIKGDLQDEGIDIQGDPTFEPFKDRLGNLLVGWTGSFVLDIPNTVQNCVAPVIEEGIFDNTFDNTFN